MTEAKKSYGWLVSVAIIGGIAAVNAGVFKPTPEETVTKLETSADYKADFKKKMVAGCMEKQTSDPANIAWAKQFKLDPSAYCSCFTENWLADMSADDLRDSFDAMAKAKAEGKRLTQISDADRERLVGQRVREKTDQIGMQCLKSLL